MKVHLTLKSSNAKVGPIPVSTSDKDSCPDSCPLKGSGCYASSGPLSLHWNKIPERGMEWSDFCAKVASFPENQLWRHNQAGDLPHTDGKIDAKMVSQLIEANKGKRGYTYTHHDLDKPVNYVAIKACNDSGFTVNLSADNLSEADEFHAHGIAPVCVILPSDVKKNFFTKSGNKVVICPAVTRDNVTCESCKLCANSKRQAIIGFPAHGTQKKKASAISLGA